MVPHTRGAHQGGEQGHFLCNRRDVGLSVRPDLTAGGAAMVPIESLRREHRLIVAVLDAAEYEAEQIARRGGFDAADSRRLYGFLPGFCPRLPRGQRGVSSLCLPRTTDGDLHQLSLVPFLRGYDECRRELQAIANLLLPSIQGDYWTALALAEHIRSYCQQMRSHIEREENEVFALAEAVLKPADEEALIHEFRVLTGKVGMEVIHRQRQIARALSHYSEPETACSSDVLEIHFG